MVRLKGEKCFEGRTLTDLRLSWAYVYQEVTIDPNRFL